MTRLPQLLLLVSSISGCVTTEVSRTYTDRDGVPVTETRRGNAATYGLYTDAVKRVAESNYNREPINNTCAKGDSVCTVAVAGFNAVAAQAAINNQQVNVAPPQRERDIAEQARDWLSGIATLAVPAYSAYSNIAMSKVHRDETLGLYETLGGIIQSNNQAAADIATAGPSITVGGDYISGSDNVTGDGNATRGSQIGDNTSTTVGRDQTGRDHNDGALIGDSNRIDSPNGGNGGNCAGGNGAPGGAGGDATEGSNGNGGNAAPGGVGGNCSGGG